MTNSALLRLEDGRHVPMSAVRELRPVPNEAPWLHRLDVIGLDGLTIGQISKRELAGATVVPANPGWRIGYYFAEDDEDLGMILMPIIAWRIESAGSSVVPIATTGAAEACPYVVVSPDGQTSEPRLRASWATLELATAALRGEDAVGSRLASEATDWRMYARVDAVR